MVWNCQYGHRKYHFYKSFSDFCDLHITQLIGNRFFCEKRECKFILKKFNFSRFSLFDANFKIQQTNMFVLNNFNR